LNENWTFAFESLPAGLQIEFQNITQMSWFWAKSDFLFSLEFQVMCSLKHLSCQVFLRAQVILK